MEQEGVKTNSSSNGSETRHIAKTSPFPLLNKCLYHSHMIELYLGVARGRSLARKTTTAWRNPFNSRPGGAIHSSASTTATNSTVTAGHLLTTVAVSLASMAVISNMGRMSGTLPISPLPLFPGKPQRTIWWRLFMTLRAKPPPRFPCGLASSSTWLSQTLRAGAK